MKTKYETVVWRPRDKDEWLCFSVDDTQNHIGWAYKNGYDEWVIDLDGCIYTVADLRSTMRDICAFMEQLEKEKP